MPPHMHLDGAEHTYDRRVSSTPPRRSALQDTFGIDADGLAERIRESPIMLGLTDGVPAFERIIDRPVADQFAVILFDPAAGARIVVEVQLGDADEDQLRRAVELWDAEKSRMPVEHRAAAAAEHFPPDVVQAASLERPDVRLELVELHAERIGNIVAVEGEPLV